MGKPGVAGLTDRPGPGRPAAGRVEVDGHTGLAVPGGSAVLCQQVTCAQRMTDPHRRGQSVRRVAGAVRTTDAGLVPDRAAGGAAGVIETIAGLPDGAVPIVDADRRVSPRPCW